MTACELKKLLCVDKLDLKIEMTGHFCSIPNVSKIIQVYSIKLFKGNLGIRSFAGLKQVENFNHTSDKCQWKQDILLLHHSYNLIGTCTERIYRKLKWFKELWYYEKKDIEPMNIWIELRRKTTTNKSPS